MVTLRALSVVVVLIGLALLTVPFALHAIRQGWDGLSGELAGISRFYSAGAANPAIFGHMLAGGVLTILAPLQLLPVLRRQAPALHRASGYIIASLAGIAGIGGLVYIGMRGTIGGPVMSVGFALYGSLLLLAAFQTLRHARAGRRSVHRRWALRLFVLAIGSWIYRVHYGVWFALTDGLATTPDFTGLFDRLTIFAFYLPYLAGLELWFRLRGGRGSGRRPRTPPPEPASS